MPVVVGILVHQDYDKACPGGESGVLHRILHPPQGRKYNRKPFCRECIPSARAPRGSPMRISYNGIISPQMRSWIRRIPRLPARSPRPMVTDPGLNQKSPPSSSSRGWWVCPKSIPSTSSNTLRTLPRRPTGDPHPVDDPQSKAPGAHHPSCRQSSLNSSVVHVARDGHERVLLHEIQE